MNKVKIIKILQQATLQHIDWVRQGRYLVKGLAQDKVKKPQDCEALAFGQWYTDEGYKLVNIPQLEKLHELHQEAGKAYTALYYMTFDRRKQARSTLILADDIEVPVEERNFRQQKLNILEDKVKQFLNAIQSVEKQVTSLEEETFDSVWFS
jgi:hypothetical protein